MSRDLDLDDVVSVSPKATAELQSLRQQLAAAQESIENEQAKSIHSCHANCTMDGCVNRKLRQQLAAALATCKLKDKALEQAASHVRPTCGELYDILAEALAIQPDDSALTDFLGEPVAWVDECGFLFHTVNEPDEYTPLYSPKWSTK